MQRLKSFLKCHTLLNLTESDFSTHLQLSLNYMSIVPISRITLSLCDGGKRSQKFEFTYKKDVHLKSVPNTCWDFQGGDRQEIQQYPCHGQKGNPLFKYVSIEIVNKPLDNLLTYMRVLRTLFVTRFLDGDTLPT